MKRREFLIKSGCALSMTALAAQTEYFGLMTAMAQKSKAPLGKNILTPPSDYRALVCIFLMGGNDGNNMLVPNHNDSNVSNYAAYSQARAADGLALAQNTLLPISVPRVGNLSYGLHPSFGTVTGGINGGLHELWAQQKMAIVTNAGTLVQPLTRLQYQQGAARPRQLFSHTDQTNQHQNANADVVMLSGWGGRMSDKMTVAANPNRLIPTVCSTVGTQVFTIGDSTQPVSIGSAPTPLSNVLALTGYNNTPASNARFDSLNQGFSFDQGQDLIAASNDFHRQAIAISRSLNTTAEVTAAFPNTEIGNQLKQIARLIKNRSVLNVNRQIFFCTLDGFDTHTGQITGQARLLTMLSQAMRSFYNEMTVQGAADKVTQFTMSDFNRTFDAGASGGSAGSDHAWANHHLVVGDAVLGGDFYGMNTTNGTPFPTLVMNGPDDADSGSARGRWIPTTSVEQYAGTLARWFGLETADMNYVFPNIANFPTNDLGFMSV